VYETSRRNKNKLCSFSKGKYLEVLRIYGPKYENGEWKCRTNSELEGMSKGESRVKWIKGQRISWLGHLERMEEDRLRERSSFKN
jgi:hypothetical protein